MGRQEASTWLCPSSPDNEWEMIQMVLSWRRSRRNQSELRQTWSIRETSEGTVSRTEGQRKGWLVPGGEWLA